MARILTPASGPSLGDAVQPVARPWLDAGGCPALGPSPATRSNPLPIPVLGWSF